MSIYASIEIKSGKISSSSLCNITKNIFTILGLVTSKDVVEGIDKSGEDDYGKAIKILKQFVRDIKLVKFFLEDYIKAGDVLTVKILTSHNSSYLSSPYTNLTYSIQIPSPSMVYSRNFSKVKCTGVACDNCLFCPLKKYCLYHELGNYYIVGGIVEDIVRIKYRTFSELVRLYNPNTLKEYLCEDVLESARSGVRYILAMYLTPLYDGSVYIFVLKPAELNDLNSIYELMKNLYITVYVEIGCNVLKELVDNIVSITLEYSDVSFREDYSKLFELYCKVEGEILNTLEYLDIVNDLSEDDKRLIKFIVPVPIGVELSNKSSYIEYGLIRRDFEYRVLELTDKWLSTVSNTASHWSDYVRQIGRLYDDSMCEWVDSVGKIYDSKSDKWTNKFSKIEEKWYRNVLYMFK